MPLCNRAITIVVECLCNTTVLIVVVDVFGVWAGILSKMFWPTEFTFPKGVDVVVCTCSTHVLSHSGSKCRKPAKKISSPKVISRDFSCKFLKIFTISVSGCLCYAFKICQIGAGTSKICQFNDLSKSHFWRAFEIWPDCVAASASPRWVSWTICFETRLDPGLLDYYIVVQRLWAPGCCVRGCWASKVHTYVHSLRSRCCSQRLAQEPRQRLPQCTHSEK